MAKQIYQVDRSVYAAQRRRYRRRVRLATIAILAVVLAAAAVAYNLYGPPHTSGKSAAGPTYTQRIAGPQLFRSSYFEFSDSSTWVYTSYDSTATMLTYLLYESGVPAHSLTVYINQTPTQDDLAVNHVLPVQIKNGNSFTVGSVSPACDSQDPNASSESIHTMTLSGSSIICRPDSPQFSMVVGQVGGNYNLSLRRSDGKMANYIIVYHNLTVNPDPAPFVRIMQSFQTL